MKKLQKPVRKIPTISEGLGIATITEMVEHSVEKHSEYLAYRMTRDGEIFELTFGETLKYIRSLAEYLKELGLGPGDHIAILGENRPEWGISYFSIAWIGAVAIPLDARASLKTHKLHLSYSSAKTVILSGSFLPEIESFKLELEDLKHIIVMDRFGEIRERFPSGVESEKVSPDTLMEILFTSGTTGDPKGVMLTHRNIMSNVDDICKILEFSPQDRAFSILPIHHSYECTGGLITTFCNGVSVFYATSFKPREMLAELKMSKPTIWLNTPLVLEKLYSRIESELSSQKGIKGILGSVLPKTVVGNRVRNKIGLEDIRLMVCGGAALPTWVSNGLEELGFPLIQGYGLSETSPLISVNPPSDPKNKSVGMIIPSDEVEIRDTDNEGNGEILVRGPNVMKGYYKNERATEEVMSEDGWLLTGDVGYFDQEGYLYITGRKKFVIVTKGGKNVYPEEIEEKLTKSPYIEEALVFSPDDERIQALIYPVLEEVLRKFESKGEKPEDDKIWEFIKTEVRAVNDTMEAYKRVSHFALKFEEFPKTTTQKIKRYMFKNVDLDRDTKVF